MAKPKDKSYRILHLSVDKEVADALEAAAKDQRRSVSAMARLILEDMLKKAGTK